MWRRRFSQRSLRINKENDEILNNNTRKYRKKIQSTIHQLNRTKKNGQRHFDSSDSEVHVARLINDIGQLSDGKSLQEITSLIDSIAMRYQLSCQIFNEYGTNALLNALEKINSSLLSDFERTKSVLEEAQSTRCSNRTQQTLQNKVQDEWIKHQKLANHHMKHGLSSYCQIASKHVQLQMAMLDKLQTFVDQMPEDDINLGLPDFSARSSQTRRELDVMLRMLLDTATADLTLTNGAKRPKFLEHHHSISNSLFSSEVAEALSNSNRTPTDIVNSFSSSSNVPQTPEHQSVIVTPRNIHELDMTPRNSNNLPSYTDLFIVPATCRQDPFEINESYRNQQQ